ncbi:MAG: GxxExxY protein [Spirochaetota bacterium]
MPLLLEKESFAIRGAVFDVYKELGCGFLEAVYQECLEIELARKEIPFISQPKLQIQYKNKTLKQIYKPDFICFGKIIMELKATKNIDPVHKAQTLNYLKATQAPLALLINFGSHPKVQIERLLI